MVLESWHAIQPTRIRVCIIGGEKAWCIRLCGGYLRKYRCEKVAGGFGAVLIMDVGSKGWGAFLASNAFCEDIQYEEK